MSLSLPHAVPGERHELASRAGRLSYYADGSGQPLLLVHSVNAAGSAYDELVTEMLDRGLLQR